MRTLLTGELTQAQDYESDDYVKLEVQNASGTWIDVGAALGTHWIINASWGEHRDTPVSQATFTLLQRIGDASLAPLMSASVLNVDDDDNYAPLLYIGRLVRAYTATMPAGVPLDISKYREVFTGRIDDVNSADQEPDKNFGPITIQCSDLGAWLMSLQIRNSGTQYGNLDTPPALEDVLQRVIDDNIPSGKDVTLVKQSSSVFGVTVWNQGETKLLEALITLVSDSVGEDLRYRYDSSHISQLMWFDPGRNRETVDATFGPESYILRTLDLALRDVRNDGEMSWADPSTGATGTVYSRDDASIESITGGWPAFFRLPSSTMITSEAEAQTVLDTVVHDLSEPPAEASAELPYFWPVQLYDRYTFEANDRQYDDDQTFAVAGYQHTIENGRGSTTLTLTGKVIGAYARWLRKISQVEAPSLRLKNFRETERTSTSVTYSWENSGAIEQIWLYLVTKTQPVTSDPWAELQGMPTTRFTSDTTSYTVSLPPVGQIKYVRLVPIAANGKMGKMWDFTVQPNDAIPFITKPIQTIPSGGLTVDLKFTVGDPAGLGGTLYVWTNHDVTGDADSSLTYEGSYAIADTDPPVVVDNTTVFNLSAGGTDTLLDDIRVHPGKGKRIFAEFVNSQGTSSGIQSILLQPGTSPVDDNNDLIPGIIHDYTPFASNLTPIKLVDDLLTPGEFDGEIVFLKTDKKLYRWDGDAEEWTAKVETVDLDGTIDTDQIANLAVTAAKIGASAVEAGKIAANAVTSTEIAALAVTTAKIAASAVETAKIANDAVEAAKIASGAVTTAKIATGAVTANEIAALTILAGNIAAGAITTAKIAALAVTASEIAAGAITTAKLDALAVTAAKIAANTITAAQIAANTITAAQIAAGTITANEIAANTITAAKIAALTITGAEIAAGAITASKIAANTITANEIASDTITAGQIAAGAVSTSELAASAVTAAKIATGTITANEIAAGTITASKIATGTITANEIATGTITADKIVANSITPAQVQGRNRCRVEKSSDQSLSTGSATAVTFDTEVFDIGGLHSTVSNTDRITIPTGGDTGTWLLIGQCRFAASNVGRRQVSIKDSAGNVYALFQANNAGASQEVDVNVFAFANTPSVGEYFYLEALQTSGLNLNVNGGGSFTYFTAIHLW